MARTSAPRLPRLWFGKACGRRPAAAVPGAMAASSEQGEGERQEAAGGMRHDREPSERRAAAGASRARRGAADRPRRDCR